MTAVFKREFRAYFMSPLGYTFIAIFMLISGLFFLSSNILEQSSRFILTLGSITFIFALLVPVLTMRSFAEEKKSKTDQLILTAPIKLSDVVLGKFLAATSVIVIALVATMVFPFILLLFNANIEIWTTIGGYLGNLLIGMALISIGMFISSMTENQLTSAVVSITVFLFMLLIDSLRSMFVSGWLYEVLGWISMFSRMDTFSAGILSLPSVFYYLSITVLFLFLTTRMIEKRRWS